MPVSPPTRLAGPLISARAMLARMRPWFSPTSPPDAVALPPSKAVVEVTVATAELPIHPGCGADLLADQAAHGVSAGYRA